MPDELEIGAVVVGQDLPPEESTSEEETPETTPETPAEEAAPAEEEGVAAEEPKDEEEETEKVDPLTELINKKYGGDRGKFVNGLYEQWNSASKMRAEINELKAQIAARQEEAEEEAEEALAPPPELESELQRLDGEITSLSAQMTQADRDGEALIRQGEALQVEIAKLEGKLELADEFQQEKISRQLNEKKSELRDLGRDYKSLGKDKRDLANEKRALEQRKVAAQKQIEQHREQQKNWGMQSKQAQIEIRGKFDQAFSELYKEYNFPDDDKYRAALDETVRAEIAFHIQNLPPGAPTVDVVAAAKALVAKHATMRGVTVKQAVKKLSQEKTQGRAPVAPKGTMLPAEKASPSSKKENWTPEFVRARARRILGS